MATAESWTLLAPKLTVPLIKPDLPSLDEMRDSFEEILANGRITNFGKYVTEFESETGVYLGARTVAVSSGTMGLLFTLSALGIRPGDEVILPSFTFMATAQAILWAGGIPVFAEVEDDLNLSPADLENVLEQHPNAAAVIAVHMYGLPADAAQLQSIVDAASRKRNRKIHLIFDAAHAFGAAIGDRRIGSFGDAEVFSLSVTKVLVSVEGGLVSTRNPELIERIRHMRNYGILSNYNAHFPGLNGKMSEFHAIVGLHNLRRLDALMTMRQQRARRYFREIEKYTRFQPIPWPSGVTHTFKDLTVQVPGQAQRDAVMKFLSERGVESRAYFFPPVHEQEHFRRFATRPLPRTESLARSVITLPFYTSISDEEIDYVVAQLAGAERSLL